MDKSKAPKKRSNNLLVIIGQRLTHALAKNKLKIVKTATRHMKPDEVFVSRLHTDTSAEDLKKYVTSQFKNASNVECEKLKTRLDLYNSFMVTLHDVTFHESMNLDNWPKGALVKRFYSPKKTAQASLNCIEEHSIGTT